MNNRFQFLTAGGIHTDAGLLLLRVTIAGSLLLKHGWEKVFTFSSMAQHFPDPIHAGPVPTLVIAMIGDFVCSLLVIFGLGTRWAALYSFLNLFAAWAFVHRFAFLNKQQGGHGELIVLYLGVMMTLFLTGAGRYSLDEVLTRSRL